MPKGKVTESLGRMKQSNVSCFSHVRQVLANFTCSILIRRLTVATVLLNNPHLAGTCRSSFYSSVCPDGAFRLVGGHGTESLLCYLTVFFFIFFFTQR